MAVLTVEPAKFKDHLLSSKQECIRRYRSNYEKMTIPRLILASIWPPSNFPLMSKALLTA